MSLKFAISGGGTGGHIYPGIAIANAILQLEPNAKILFIGGKGQRESKIIPDAGFEFAPILVQSFPRSLSWKWLKVFVKVPAGFLKSLVILSKFKPDIVIGTGGYVCGPVLLAGLFLRKTIVIQEQNVLPGITNRILGRWSKEIYTHFAESVKYFPKEKTRITGNPVRAEVINALPCHEKLGLDKNKFTISAFGASQGAKSINMAMIDALPYLSELSSEIQIVHQTGEKDIQTVKEAYSKYPITAIIQPFFFNIYEVYASTDLMVCRSSAMTLSEIALRGLPAILIPYPYAAEDHQTFNAKALEENGAGIMIKDRELKGKNLADTIISLLKDKNRLAEMAKNSKALGKPNSTQEIAKSILNIIKNKMKN
jgi:UDP-N-acetylglucosamine--N-acetylmuramyl-(pentapeptide) pyrophosphoryl-undecaprenol N-acetylglucosamine transferase